MGPFEYITDPALYVDQERFHVYISGPVTGGGWVFDNVREAIAASEELSAEGFVPMLPQLNIFWDFHRHADHPDAKEYEFWLYQITAPWVQKCDYLVRLPGISFGADFEEQVARYAEIPVFYSTTSLINHHKGVMAVRDGNRS